MIPKGFKVTNDGKTIPEGVVIEDANENQFVWIPVGTVHKDSNLENDITIKLGRYTFDRNTEMMYQMEHQYFSRRLCRR
ncbi:MAG: hypothetical protein ACLR6T_00470 [Intestinibacter sp.]